MKPSQIHASLVHLTQRRRPPMIWGPPGAGKSDVVAQVAKTRKVELRDVRLSLMDPTDIKGFPMIATAGTEKQMSWAPPDFLPTKGEGILFLDELPSAPSAVQAAAYQLILNFKVGDYELPKGWSIVAAGNRATDRALVHAMPSALANRFVHLDFEVDLEDWYTWATANGVSDLTRGFLRFRPSLLHSFDPKTNERAFPTPRSWVFVDDVIKSDLPASTELELIQGTVGPGAAAEFIAHIRMAKDLPTPDEVLLNPEKAPIPESPAAKYAICAALDQHATKATMGRLLKYVTRMDPEYQVLFMRSAAKANREVTQSKDYTEWLIKNEAVLR